MKSGRVLLKQLRKKCWKYLKERSAKEKLVKEEVNFRSGGWCEETRHVSLENGVKTVGQ